MGNRIHGRQSETGCTPKESRLSRPPTSNWKQERYRRGTAYQVATALADELLDVCRDMIGVHHLNSDQLLSDVPPEVVLFGKSLAMEDLKQKLVRICSTSVSVLLQGEIGVGKAVLSRFIHKCSSWLEGPYRRVNCAALPCSFGYLNLSTLPRLSQTGRSPAGIGETDFPPLGTIFLDQVSELNPRLQYQISNALAERDLAKMLQQPSEEKGVRIIGANIRSLHQEVRVGRFRPELFYRLAVVTIDVPPLRNRIEDLPELIEYFRLRYTSKLKTASRPFPASLVSRALSYRWPGNIRELESFVCRCVLLGCDRCSLGDGNPISKGNRECESKCGSYIFGAET
jgi:DNA-binding NtrC family response regulator